mgnify:CR=1 FL=1
MITQKLKTILWLSIPIFIAHGLEEFLNNFYNVDWSTKLVFGFLDQMSVPQATFLVFQIMLWLALIVFAFLISSEKWRLRLMFIPAVIFIVELHHPWSVITSWGYYPGAITAIPLLIVGFFYWIELLRSYKTL